MQRTDEGKDRDRQEGRNGRVERKDGGRKGDGERRTVKMKGGGKDWEGEKEWMERKRQIGGEEFKDRKKVRRNGEGRGGKEQTKNQTKEEERGERQ